MTVATDSVWDAVLLCREVDLHPQLTIAPLYHRALQQVVGLLKACRQVRLHPMQRRRAHRHRAHHHPALRRRTHHRLGVPPLPRSPKNLSRHHRSERLTIKDRCLVMLPSGALSERLTKHNISRLTTAPKTQPSRSTCPSRVKVRCQSRRCHAEPVPQPSGWKFPTIANQLVDRTSRHVHHNISLRYKRLRRRNRQQRYRRCQ